MVTYFQNYDSTSLTYLQYVLEDQAGIVFNCYYSVTDPTAMSSTNGYGLNIIGWNILYNLGYMYTDGKGVYAAA